MPVATQKRDHVEQVIHVRFNTAETLVHESQMAQA